MQMYIFPLNANKIGSLRNQHNISHSFLLGTQKYIYLNIIYLRTTGD